MATNYIQNAITAANLIGNGLVNAAGGWLAAALAPPPFRKHSSRAASLCPAGIGVR